MCVGGGGSRAGSTLVKSLSLCRALFRYSKTAGSVEER